MKTIQLNKSSLDLPDCWEDLSYKEKIFTFEILGQLFAGTITPEIARLKMLVEYTGYKPSWIRIISETLQKSEEQREIIHFNLLKLSEELNFAFTVKDSKIIPNHVFKTNPVPFLKIGNIKYYGRRFEIGTIPRTDITAREFSDCFDIFASIKDTLPDADRHDCINQICAILFPKNSDYTTNLVSGHHRQMRRLQPVVRFGIIFWFTGIVRYYTTHPVYGLLFKRDKGSEDAENKVNLGMNEIALTLQKEGFGKPDTMNLNDYFDAQIKYLKDIINKAISEGMKPQKLSDKSGIPMEVINQLT